MVRLRRVPVLVSTLALVAGCGSADRVEVSGVVRDGRTGSPVAGARVTGADGVATHTDAEGRFTLAVMRGLRTQLRVSAEGHVDAVQSLDVEAGGTLAVPAALAFELEPLVVSEEDALDPEAVVRWMTTAWMARRFSRGHAETRHDLDRGDASGADGGWIDDGTARDPDPDGRDPCPALLDSSDTSTSDHDAPITVGGVPAPWLGAGSRCVSCHRDDVAGIEANVLVEGAHAGLGDSCLSCHAEDGAFEPSSCARCHGESIGGRVGGDTARDTHRTWNVELDVAVAAHPSYDAAIRRARGAMSARLSASAQARARDARLAAWMQRLARDGSRGAHDPRLVRRLHDAAGQPSPAL